MKVLYVIAGLNRGGAETFIMNIYRNINRKEHKIYFLVYSNRHFDYEGEIKALGGTIIREKKSSQVGLIKFIRNLKELFIKEKFDVIHAHSLFNSGPVMYAAYKAHIKIRISHCHTTKKLKTKESLKDKIYYLICKYWINKYSTHLFACSEEAGRFLFYKKNKFYIVKNGVDIDKFKYNDSCRKKIRKKYNINDNMTVIGNVGRLVAIKNQKFLLDIFKIFYQTNKNAKLLILGDGQLKNELINYSKKIFLDETSVLFLGNVSNVNEFYNAFDIFVLPSLFEGLPYTLIEAQCNGLPIIASDTVDQTSNITGNIIFCNLKESTNKWSELIKSNQNRRYDATKSIVQSGYSIADTVEFIESIYAGKVVK